MELYLHSRICLYNMHRGGFKFYSTANHAVNWKGKVVPVNDINACLGMEGRLQEFLTSALDEGGWSATRTVFLYPFNTKSVELKTGLGA
jgi:hypothetical protein